MSGKLRILDDSNRMYRGHLGRDANTVSVRRLELMVNNARCLVHRGGSQHRPQLRRTGQGMPARLGNPDCNGHLHAQRHRHRHDRVDTLD